MYCVVFLSSDRQKIGDVIGLLLLAGSKNKFPMVQYISNPLSFRFIFKTQMYKQLIILFIALHAASQKKYEDSGHNSMQKSCNYNSEQRLYASEKKFVSSKNQI